MKRSTYDECPDMSETERELYYGGLATLAAKYTERAYARHEPLRGAYVDLAAWRLFQGRKLAHFAAAAAETHLFELGAQVSRSPSQHPRG